MTLVLFWDLDGTLLTTARAGIHAWEEAAAAVVGRPVDFSTLHTAGYTDVEIAARILEAFDLDARCPELVLDLVRRYEAALPGCLGRRQGRVLPGAREILEAVKGRPDVLSMLLTGNTAAGARAKLRHYGLDGLFVHGAFADGCPDRRSIARNALAMAGRILGAEPDARRMFVIGDTPRDVECAHEIGARAVAVASGSYSLEELGRCGAWWVLPELPPPGVFLGRLLEP